MPRHLARHVFAVLLGASSLADAQSAVPTIRELLKVDSGWVFGVAEPASGRFLVYAADAQLKVYNRQTKKTSTIASKVFNGTGNPSISRSGNRVVFAADDETGKKVHIWAVDLDTLTGTPTSEPRRVSIVPAVMASISSDGRWIALSANDDNVRNINSGKRLLVMPSEGGEARVLDSALRVMTPRWTPDGKSIFYIRGRGNGPALARIRVSGGPPDSLALATTVVGVSPDGKNVAYAVDVNGSQRSFKVATVDGRTVAQFSINGDDVHPYAWAASGGATLVGFRQVSPATLKTVSLSDGRVEAFPVTEQYPSAVRFAPDGSRLGILTKVDGRDQIVVYDLKTKARKVLRSDAIPQRSSWQWSPDGTRIAFTNLNDNNTSQIFVVQADGSHRRALTIGDVNADPAWSPDGRQLAYDVFEIDSIPQRPLRIFRVNADGSDARAITLDRTTELSSFSSSWSPAWKPTP